MQKSLSTKTYLAYFKDPRLVQIFIFGMASGFPWVIVGSAMSAWLKDGGHSKTNIGLFSMLFAPFAINFLWAPLIDRFKIPFLSTRLGNRRSWILLPQLCILSSTCLLTLCNPQSHLGLMAILCLIISTAAATQDIAIDGYRIDIIPPEESQLTTPAAAMATSGWWTGYAILGAMPFFIVDSPHWEWQQTYQILCVILGMLISTLFFAKEPDTHREHAQAELTKKYQQSLRSHTSANDQWIQLKAWLMVTLIAPIQIFFRNNGTKIALALLAFIFLFKIGEAFLGRMSIPFYKEIGFTNSQIGTYSKLGTGIITILFAQASGLFNSRLGIVKGLMISGIAMAATNLMFSVIAITGPNIPLFAITIFIDGFTQAWSTVAFVAFITRLCDRAFSATHYALLASLGNLSRTLLAGFSGFLIEGPLEDNWSLFFIITALMVTPSLLFLWWIRKPLNKIESFPP